jgi:hypothetical protein
VSAFLDRIIDLSFKRVDQERSGNLERLAVGASCLIGLPERDLLDTLPASLILQRLDERLQQIDSTENDSSVGIGELLVNVLVLMADYGSCESIGRYILQHLAPALLMNYVVDNAIKPSSISPLADALVSACQLAMLGRRELLSLTVVDDEHDSDAYRELVSCIGESYSTTY